MEVKQIMRSGDYFLGMPFITPGRDDVKARLHRAVCKTRKPQGMMLPRGLMSILTRLLYHTHFPASMGTQRNYVELAGLFFRRSFEMPAAALQASQVYLRPRM